MDPGGTPRKKAGLTDTLTKCLTGWLTGGKFSEKLPAHALVACHTPAQNDPAGTLTRELGPGAFAPRDEEQSVLQRSRWGRLPRAIRLEAREPQRFGLAGHMNRRNW